MDCYGTRSVSLEACVARRISESPSVRKVQISIKQQCPCSVPVGNDVPWVQHKINAPRSSSHLTQPEYLPSSQNLIKSSAPKTHLLHSLPTARRWTRGLNFNLKIALNYFCGDHLPELLMWLSGKGLQQRQQAPRIRRTGTKKGEERQRERGMEQKEGERMRAYIKATFSDICALGVESHYEYQYEPMEKKHHHETSLTTSVSPWKAPWYHKRLAPSVKEPKLENKVGTHRKVF
ncbi:hypothetical protein Q8A73_011732 [Channa argus]|nr:hypothetical protein Q8A73_011732 [Channa argus]